MRELPFLNGSAAKVTRTSRCTGVISRLIILVFAAHCMFVMNAIVAGELYEACEMGDLETARKLLSAGSNPDERNARGRTPLAAAIAEGHLNVIELLVANGATMDLEIGEGVPLLLLAASKNRPDVVRMMVNAGASTKGKFGAWPLYEVVSYGDTGLARFLIHKGADVNSRNWDGNTPLYEAISDHNLSMATVLFSEGADINLCNMDVVVSVRDGRTTRGTRRGNTPLGYAAKYGDTAAVHWLLEHGADVNQIAEDNATPLVLAMRAEKKGVVRLLREYGAVDTDDPSLVRCIQALLRIFNYYHGPIDGLAGPQTSAAIGEFQTAASGEGVDGAVTEILLTTLNTHFQNTRDTTLVDRFVWAVAYSEFDGCEIRDLAAQALVRCKAASVPALKSAVLDTSCVYPTRAIEVLTEIGSASVDALISVMKSNRLHLQTKAARALGRIRNKRAIPPLVDHLPDWHLGPSCQASLSLLGWDPLTARDSIHSLIAQRAGESLRKHELTDQVLLSDIESSRYEVVQNAIYAFIGIGRSDIIPALVQKLEQDGSKVMAEAYLNSGHQDLEKAALEWASVHGYEVKEGSGATPVEWGEL